MLASSASICAAISAEFPEPLARAANGQQQCYAPDTARKTCHSLASYRPGANGGIENVAVVLVSANPVINMEAVSAVEVKAGKECGTLRKEDLNSAKFTFGGRLLTDEEAIILRQQVQYRFNNMYGHEICTTYLDQGETLLAKMTMDGVPMPASTDRQVLWVSPQDGYRVGP
jgi:hypothetical protein